MPETLDYASQTVTTSRPGHLRYWGTFLLVGAVSVPATEAAVNLYFHEQELFSLGGLLATSVFLLVSGGALAFAHTISPKWFSSAKAAAAFAAVGPIAGVAAFCLLVR